MPHQPSRRRLERFAEEYKRIKQAHPSWTDAQIAMAMGLSFETLRSYKKGAKDLVSREEIPRSGWELDGDYVVFYGLTSVPGGELRLPRETVEAIYELYSDYTLGLQRNEVARETGLSLETLDEIREILGLTHRSVPYPPWVMEEFEPGELAARTLASKERLFLKKLRERSIAWYRRRYEEILAELRDRDHLIERISNAVQPLGRIAYEPSWRMVKVDETERWAVLAFADHHVGKAIYADTTSTGAVYNVQVYRERMRRLAAEVGSFVRLYGGHLGGLYVFDLGDTFDDPMASTFPHQERLQDVYETEAIRAAIQALRDFLLDMLGMFEVVRVRAVRGNHGVRGRPLSGWFDELIWDPILAGLFEQEPRVNIVTTKAVSMAEQIGKSLFVLTHGATLGRGVQRRERDVILEVMKHWKGDVRWRYLLMGHWHHRSRGGMPYSKEAQYEWIVCPSLVGTDPYGEMVTGCTSRPAQRLFVVHPEKGIEATADLYLD